MNTWLETLEERESRLRAGGALTRQEMLEIIQSERNLRTAVMQLGELVQELGKANESLSKTASFYLNESIDRDRATLRALSDGTGGRGRRLAVSRGKAT